MKLLIEALDDDKGVREGVPQEQSCWKLLADSGYGLTRTVLMPVEHAEPNSPEARYSHDHRVTRSKIERVIGELGNVHRVIKRERAMRYSPDFVVNIIKATAVLHNYKKLNGAKDKEEARMRINELLLNYMQDHENFARRKVAILAVNGNETSCGMWADLSNKLNHIGGIFYNKSPKCWREHWNEIRLSAKHELSPYFDKLTLTGNNAVKEPSYFTWNVGFIYGSAGMGLNIGTECRIGPEDQERQLLLVRIFNAKQELLSRKRTSTKMNTRKKRAQGHKNDAVEYERMEEGCLLAELDESLRYLRDYGQSVEAATKKVHDNIHALRDTRINHGLKIN
ncbi:hypothetical protein QAD02_003056 [Eretmocerus hayati]|uniref:Uncharacterized protein n=1 Tax=Eretmocerus hayati TaxID=131215 RepID=A0ACC2NL25_9HYME|nr:hypothetical protein QAD02_003056 [Eretmocerus hayati]